ncbi:MAG TPA: hypothetical protein VG839_03010 [Asticcacaulis sp.]|nr:hypothetical protein [Asticcacaulis sp.]
MQAIKFARLLSVAIVASVALAPPIASAAKPTTIYIKPGGTWAEFVTDDETCIAAGKAAAAQVAKPGYTANPYAAGAVGFMQGLAEGKAFNKAYEDCFGGKGYLLETMDPEDAKALKKLKGDERKAWLETYYNQWVAKLAAQGVTGASASSSASDSASAAASSDSASASVSASAAP